MKSELRLKMLEGKYFPEYMDPTQPGESRLREVVRQGSLEGASMENINMLVNLIVSEEIDRKEHIMLEFYKHMNLIIYDNGAKDVLACITTQTNTFKYSVMFRIIAKTVVSVIMEGASAERAVAVSN